MSASELIPVKYSEDTAQFADIRPVRRQPMTLTELVGLVLTHTGKDSARIRELLRRGTCTFNIYKYWWEPLECSEDALETALDVYPDPDPSRAFDPDACLWARFSDATEPVPRQVLVEKAEAEKRRWFRQSLWGFLWEFAAARDLAYVTYSYYDKADIYQLTFDDSARAALLDGFQRHATRELRRRLARAAEFVRLEMACKRP